MSVWKAWKAQLDRTRPWVCRAVLHPEGVMSGTPDYPLFISGVPKYYGDAKCLHNSQTLLGAGPPMLRSPIADAFKLGMQNPHSGFWMGQLWVLVLTPCLSIFVTLLFSSPFQAGGESCFYLSTLAHTAMPEWLSRRHRAQFRSH